MTDVLPCVEIGNDNATHTIIWLHGLGADGHDFEPIVPELKLPGSIRFIFPHAPSIPVTINNNMTMPAWYDIRSSQIETEEDEAGIRNSQQAIHALIKRENDRGIATNKIILAGFSQGGAIALHTGLRYPDTLAGILGLSTYLPLVPTLEKEINDANCHTPIFLGHGKFDQIVPFHLAEDTQFYLKDNKIESELHRYPMEHTVSPDEVSDIAIWIKSLIG